MLARAILVVVQPQAVISNISWKLQVTLAPDPFVRMLFVVKETNGLI